MYLVRVPIMPMLCLSKDEEPIKFRPFRCPVPGQTAVGLQGKTLGTRKRWHAGDVAKPHAFKEESPVRPQSPSATETAANRLVLWSPPPGGVSDGRIEVSVDPVLTRVLREHQRLGVQFLFDCLMGLKSFEGYGCILADDMGLGKTLQSVSIVWTLLVQGGAHGRPACRKALVVCPASLVKNWAAEFDKWLGGRCKYTAIAETGQAKVAGSIMSFTYSHESKVLIMSYESFRGHASEVANASVDLIVCDEAHKLKNDTAETTRAIAGLTAKRRLLISGTPIQNNLDEFFTLTSVANPGVFGGIKAFKREYAAPILRGREPDASTEERREAQEKLARVSEVTEQFILRRTNRLNARFLPSKQLFNVFVLPTDFQRRMYHIFLRSTVARRVLEDQHATLNRTALGSIRKLQCLVNHPFLVRTATHKLETGFDDEETAKMFAEVDARDHGLRTAQKPVHEELSAKLALVCNFLTALKAAGAGDRCVVISNWTQTLDLIDKMCGQRKWPVHRLDGTMAIGKRMKLVADFNRAENEQAFVFLLSSKAGGCGLNLIGANRLIMYDPDWNPANDRQAMARIWRDGQQKPCFIYRLFTTGTIDEKVYQRQICKDGLSTMMACETGEDMPEMKESLAADLVKDLFMFTEDTMCATHDMLNCHRCAGGTRRGGRPRSSTSFVPQDAEVAEDDLSTWSHHPGVEGVPDEILAEAARRVTGSVSFTMGCHIEFTAEQIAKLDEEERAEQARREEAATAAGMSTAPALAAAAAATPPDEPGKRRRWAKIVPDSSGDEEPVMKVAGRE